MTRWWPIFEAQELLYTLVPMLWFIKLAWQNPVFSRYPLKKKHEVPCGKAISALATPARNEPAINTIRGDFFSSSIVYIFHNHSYYLYIPKNFKVPPKLNKIYNPKKSKSSHFYHNLRCFSLVFPETPYVAARIPDAASDAKSLRIHPLDTCCALHASRVLSWGTDGTKLDIMLR